MTDANDGRSSGAARGAMSSNWPKATPSSAPISVTSMATPDRKSTHSSTIAIADAHQFADRCLRLGADVDHHAAGGHLDAVLSLPVLTASISATPSSRLDLARI